MLVKCLANRGAALSRAYSDVFGTMPESVYDVTIGTEYSVFGVFVWRGRLHVLLMDDYSLPNWYPLELFSIIDHSIPENWFFSKNNEDAPYGCSQFLLGYNRLAMHNTHFNDILEREESEMKYFYAEVEKMKRSIL